jgi:hypothetical protein
MGICMTGEVRLEVINYRGDNLKFGILTVGHFRGLTKEYGTNFNATHQCSG